MQALESMPQQLYWSEREMQVLDYPKARLRLRLFTLSLEKSWLNL
jgi:MSHA biogenesis protein MshJ